MTKQYYPPNHDCNCKHCERWKLPVEVYGTEADVKGGVRRSAFWTPCLSSCNGLAHDDRCSNRPSLSEQMQGELEPLPGKKWDGEDIGEVLKHGRE